MTTRNVLLGSAALGLGLAAPLYAPSVPVRSFQESSAPSVSDLYDPLAMARAMCGAGDRAPSPIIQGAIAAAVPVKDEPRSPRFEGLGPLTYKITTTSPDAQFFFNQGLKLFYAFNPGEAVASFRAAHDADPNCAMCYWGEALTLGPNLNGPMFDENNLAALAAVQKAKDLSANATPSERALIDAVAARYSADKKITRDDLNMAYADAMAKVHAAYKTDPEIAAIYAEAAMNMQAEPWSRWWDKSGRYPTGYVAGAIAAIEGVLANHPEHPGAIHLYIHALDSSVYPEKVIPYADKLAALMPNAGHMVHMPAHTFFNVGRYKDALATNVAAIMVDDAYMKGAAAATPVYRHGLYQHNVHFALAAADMAGDEASAMRLIKVMEDFLAQKPMFVFDVSAAAAIHPVIRFGTPANMLAIPPQDRKRPYMVGMRHFARGTAYAYQMDTRRAAAEAAAIDKLRTGRKPQAEGMFGDLLGIAAEVVRGRAAAAEGKWTEAAERFGAAAQLQDKVPYRDPPFWDYPVRQAQGVALWRAGKLQHAAETLRQALIESPNSGYALYALKEIHATLGDTVAAAEYAKLFEKAWAGSKPPELDRL